LKANKAHELLFNCTWLIEISTLSFLLVVSIQVCKSMKAQGLDLFNLSSQKLNCIVWELIAVMWILESKSILNSILREKFSKWQNICVPNCEFWVWWNEEVVYIWTAKSSAHLPKFMSLNSSCTGTWKIISSAH